MQQANQEQQKQPWSLQVHAKANNFNFKLKATQIIPSLNFFRLSLFLKIFSFSLRVRSQRLPPESTKNRTPLRSKFSRILEKIRFCRSKKKRTRRPEAEPPKNQRPRRFNYEEPVCVGSIMAGGLAFLFRSVSIMDQRGIVFNSPIISLYLALLFKKQRTRETSNLLATLIAAMVGSSLVFDMINGLNFNGGLISECVWKICNFAVSSGCLYVFSQETFSRIFRYMKAHR